jgi:hypothetical protein
MVVWASVVYSVQSIGQLTLFVGHSRARDKTSTLLRISLLYLQLVVDSSTSVFSLSGSTYSSLVESYWLTSFWRFLSRVTLSVTMQQKWVPVIPRVADVALMDYFVTQGYKTSLLMQLVGGEYIYRQLPLLISSQQMGLPSSPMYFMASH